MKKGIFELVLECVIHAAGCNTKISLWKELVKV